jgi:hypothetical protein
MLKRDLKIEKKRSIKIIKNLKKRILWSCVLENNTHIPLVFQGKQPRCKTDTILEQSKFSIKDHPQITSRKKL